METVAGFKIKFAKEKGKKNALIVTLSENGKKKEIVRVNAFSRSTLLKAKKIREDWRKEKIVS